MNKKVLRNKAFLMSHAIDRKKMYKVGSQWVIGSTLVLLLAGGASLAHNATANADTKAPVEQPINQDNKNSSTKAIQKPTIKAPVSNPKPTSNQSNGSASNNGMTALNLGTRAQQARSWNFIQHGVDSHDYDNYQAPKKTTSSATDVKSINQQASNMYGAIKSNNNGNQNQSVASKQDTSVPNTKTPKISYSLTKPNPVVSMSSSNKQGKKANQVTNKHTLGGTEQPLKKTALGTTSSFTPTPQPANTTDESKVQGMYAYLSKDGKTLTVTGNMSKYNCPEVNFMTAFENVKWGLDKNNNTTFSNVTTLNLGNVSNFTDANGLFFQMPKLTTINQVGDWNTSNVNNMSGMFSGDTSLSNLTSLTNWNTSKVIDMSNMFNGDTSLNNINALGNWNTSKVNNMYYMFDNDTSLNNINALGNWNTFNVNNMYGMFYDDTSLNNINALGNWNTFNVNNMYGMFCDDTSLNNKTPIPNWNIDSNGTPNDSMNNGHGGVNQNNKQDMTPAKFNYYDVDNNNAYVGSGQRTGYNGKTVIIGTHPEGLPSEYIATNSNQQVTYNGSTNKVYVENVPVTNTITFHDIYGNVDGMTAPSDITETGNPSKTYTISAPSGWAFVNPDGTIASGTNNVSNDSKTLGYNAGNQTLDVAPVYYGLTYKYDKANQSLEFTSGTMNWNWNSNNAFVGSDGFSDNYAPNNITATKLKSIKLDSHINTDNVTNMSHMFESDKALQSLALPSSFNTSRVTNMTNMFNSDKALQSLTLPSSFNTSRVTNMSYMFNSDKALQSLTLPSSFNTSRVTNMTNMFNSDKALQSLTLPSSFNTSKVNNMNYMFSSDTTLQSLTLPSSFNTSSVTNTSNMFDKLNNLQYITINSSTTKLSNNFTKNIPVVNWIKYNIPQDYQNDLINTFKNINFNTINNIISQYNSEMPQSYKNDFNNNINKVPQKWQKLAYEYITSFLYAFSDIAMPIPLYQQQSNGYTSAVPNDFTKGTVGTFVRTPNPKLDTIVYYQGNNTKDTVGKPQKDIMTKLNSKTGYYSDVIINKSTTSIPSGYHLVNSDNSNKGNEFALDGNTHYVQVAPDFNFNDAVNKAKGIPNSINKISTTSASDKAYKIDSTANEYNSSASVDANSSAISSQANQDKNSYATITNLISQINTDKDSASSYANDVIRDASKSNVNLTSGELTSATTDSSNASSLETQLNKDIGSLTDSITPTYTSSFANENNDISNDSNGIKSLTSNSTSTDISSDSSEISSDDNKMAKDPTHASSYAQDASKAYDHAVTKIAQSADASQAIASASSTANKSDSPSSLFSSTSDSTNVSADSSASTAISNDESTISSAKSKLSSDGKGKNINSSNATNAIINSEEASFAYKDIQSQISNANSSASSAKSTITSANGTINTDDKDVNSFASGSGKNINSLRSADSSAVSALDHDQSEISNDTKSEVVKV